MSDYEIIDTLTTKTLKSKNLNYFFDKRSGLSVVFGETHQDDPEYSPFGPFIADIEITTICDGPGGKPCPFCYKSNGPCDGEYMSFDTFKTIFDKLPDVLQQIAFGVDAQCTSNPDVWKIMKYCRQNGVIPNVTVADITDETADQLAGHCGAVAVSRYRDKNYCYDSIKKLTDRGVEQTNMHIMISEETFPETIETIMDIGLDERLEKLNAIVFLSLKQKGRGAGFTRLSDEKFKQIIEMCLEKGISFGFDSCSAMKFLKVMKLDPKYKFYETMAEPCESGRFSAYIDVKGNYYPCSFLEGTSSLFSNIWTNGISVVDCNDFLEDVWNSRENEIARYKCLTCLEKGVSCQYYDI